MHHTAPAVERRAVAHNRLTAYLTAATLADLQRLRSRLRRLGVVASMASILRLVCALGVPLALAELDGLSPPPPPRRRRRARRHAAASTPAEAPVLSSGGSGAPEARKAPLVYDVDYRRDRGVVTVRRRAA